MRVILRTLALGDQREFLQAVHRSKELHAAWVRSPTSAEDFQGYLKADTARNERLVLRKRDNNEIVGAFNLNEIVRGVFQSAYLGYYAFTPHQGQGLMSEGMQLLQRHAFSTLKLHRIEANIQPDNLESIALVKATGFQLEGLSRRYLKIRGRWRDHQRWALLAEDWREARTAAGVEHQK